MKKQKKNEVHITTTESSESSERHFSHAKFVDLIHEKTKKTWFIFLALKVPKVPSAIFRMQKLYI